MTAPNVAECAEDIAKLRQSVHRLSINLGVKRSLAHAERLNALLLDLELEFETQKGTFNAVLMGVPAPGDPKLPAAYEDVREMRVRQIK